MLDNLILNIELKLLLREALKREMTPQEKWDQRVSFAFGSCSLANPEITREMVEREATKIYGPRPETEESHE